tara:strand:+ start:225 stop:674 length:450 start_codon:yes stop_codon:yes gene_type:complete
MKLIYLILIIFLNTNVFSEEKNDSHFYIDSDKLIITEQPLTSEFIGNAYARDAVHHFYGNRILVNYDNNKKIELITIIKNVKIVRPNEEIFGDRAIYDLKLENIIVSGNVSVKKDGDVLRGSQLIVDLINSTSTIKGNKDKQVSVKVAN